MTHNLATYVRNNFDGMLVFGDVHGDYESFRSAHDFAKRENFFFMSLGDLVDRAHNPFEVVRDMYDAMYDGRAGFVIGNHDEKHYRAAKGNKVSFSRDGKQTIDDVGVDRIDEFHRMYSAIVEDTMFSNLFHTFDDITLVHAASHPCIWDNGPIKKTEKSRFLVGETNGKTMADGYPVRLYNWIDEIPIGKTVMVGHDRMPIRNIPIEKPMQVSNKTGGKVIFLDTGCGKGGFLTGAVMLVGKKGFRIDNFVEFKK
jgi:protein phosphatase